MSGIAGLLPFPSCPDDAMSSVTPIPPCTPLLLLVCLLVGGLWGCLEADSRGENNVLNNKMGETMMSKTSGACECEDGALCDAQGICQCPTGTWGTRCEETCTCQNSGSCDEGATGSGACTCVAGTYGAQCENTCACQDPFLCRDGATGDGVCVCTNGNLAPECGTSGGCECKNGALCEGPKDACVCPAGFYGPLCEDTCECENGGSCDEGATGSGACTCAAGFWGPLCKDSCQCQGASCDMATGTCGQGCAAKTFGAQCDMACSCQNGALCNEGKTGDGSCTCTPGFFGAQCEKACTCENGATCAEGAGGDGSCTCKPGTFGPTCALACPGGQATPCSNHGTCDEGATGSGACTCDAGFAGPACAMTSSCQSPGSVAGDVMIVEVMFDAPNGGAHGEPEAEYVLLYNNSCGTITTTGWNLCDSAGCQNMKPLTFAPGQVITIIESLGPKGYAAYGCTPGALVFDKVSALTSGKWFASNLSNSGDAVEIKNAAGLRIDAMSYGSNSSVFSPPVPGQSDGEAAFRLGYPWRGTLPPNPGATAWEPNSMTGHLCSVATGQAL